ncbi:MAG: sodium:solute symporter family transporter [Desulfocucumaceae bacterium]
MSANITVMVIVGIYLLAMAVIGFNAYRRVKTASDYFIYGKQIGTWFLAIATFSSIMSGFGFVGGPGLVYAKGTSSLWITFAQSLAFPLAYLVLGKRMRLLAETREVLTVPDAVHARYNCNVSRFCMAVALLVACMAYMGTQILSTGLVMVSIFNCSLVTGLLIANAVVLFYCVVGGMIAGVDTDFVQGFIMVFASVAVFFAALFVGGGMTNINTTLAGVDPNMIGPFGAMPILTCLTWYFVFAIGNSGQPHMIHKFYMIKDPKKLAWAALLSGVAYMLCSLLWMSVGLSMRAMVATGANQPLANPDLAAPTFLLNFTHPVLAGIVFGGLLAAIMSTGSAFANIGAACIARDIPAALGFTVKNQLSAGRWATVAIMVVSTLVAFYAKMFVAILGAVGWGLFAGAIVPALGIGLNWKRATKEAAVAAILFSVIFSVGVELLARFKIWTMPNGIISYTFGLMGAIIIFVAVSYLTTPQPLSRDVEAVIET